MPSAEQRLGRRGRGRGGRGRRSEGGEDGADRRSRRAQRRVDRHRGRTLAEAMTPRSTKSLRIPRAVAALVRLGYVSRSTTNGGPMFRRCAAAAALAASLPVSALAPARRRRIHEQDPRVHDRPDVPHGARGPPARLRDGAHAPEVPGLRRGHARPADLRQRRAPLLPRAGAGLAARARVEHGHHGGRPRADPGRDLGRGQPRAPRPPQAGDRAPGRPARPGAGRGARRWSPKAGRSTGPPAPCTRRRRGRPRC